MAKKGATYTLSVLLKLNDQLSGRLGRSVTALGKFERKADASLKRWAALRRELNKSPSVSGLSKYDAKLRQVSGHAQSAARGVGKVNTALNKPVNTAGLDAAIRRTRTLRREQERLVDGDGGGARGPRVTGSRGVRRGGGGGGDAGGDNVLPFRDRRRERQSLGTRASHVLEAGRDFRDAFGTIADFARPALEQIRSEARFRVMGFPEDERARGMAAVEETTRTVKGVKKSDVIETLTALTSTFGDVDQAKLFLPIAAKYRANMATLYGDQYGAADINRQISNTFKALELLGVDRPTGAPDATGQRTFSDEDRARMERYFNTIAQATAATGGDINPAEFRAFAKYGRTALMGLSPEGLQKLLPLVQQLGGSQTGTALMSLNQNLIGGQMHAYKLAEWERMGLLDKSKVEVTKAGLVKRMRPGAIPMAETLLTDPMAFADNLAAKFRERGIDTTDFNQVNKQLSAMLGNRTSAGALSQMINYRSSLDKEARNYERALKVTDTYGTLFEGQSPLANFLNLQTQWQNAQASEAMSLVNKGGGAAGTVANFFNQHPDVGAAITGITSLGKASTEAASGVGLLKDALAGLGGVSGGGGGGGVFGSGVGLGEAVGTGYVGWQGLKRLGVRAGGGLLGALGSGPAAVGAAGAASLYLIHKRYTTDKAEREKATSDAGGLFEQTKRLRQQHGGRLPAEMADKIARESFPGVDRALLLSQMEPKNYGTPGYPGVYVKPQYDTNAVLAGEFSRRAPQLQFPELMRAFIQDTRRRADSGQIPKTSADQTLSVAAKAFPEAYKAASESLATELNNLAQHASAPAQSLGDLQKAAEPVPGSLLRVGSAANALAYRLGSLQIEPPSFSNLTLVPTVHTAAPASTTFGSPQPTGPKRLPFSFPLIPSKASGGVVERGGFVQVHDREAIVPARVTRRWKDDAVTPRRPPALTLPDAVTQRRPSVLTLPPAAAGRWNEQQAAARPSDGRGAAAFLPPLDDGAMYGGSFDGSSVVEIHAPVSIKIEGGGDAGAVAEQVRAELARHRSELAALIEAKTNPRRFRMMLGREEERRREIA